MGYNDELDIAINSYEAFAIHEHRPAPPKQAFASPGEAKAILIGSTAGLRQDSDDQITESADIEADQFQILRRMTKIQIAYTLATLPIAEAIR